MTRTAHGRHSRTGLRQPVVFDGDFPPSRQNITVILDDGPDDGPDEGPAWDGTPWQGVSEPVILPAPPALAPPDPEPHVLGPAPVPITEPPAIGDHLRSPVTWCEMHPCISWHRHPESAGYADDRHRAITAGWRVDGLGRLACPPCQQSHPGYRTPQAVAWHHPEVRRRWGWDDPAMRLRWATGEHHAEAGCDLIDPEDAFRLSVEAEYARTAGGVS